MQSLLLLLVAVLTVGSQTAGTEQKPNEEDDYGIHVISSNPTELHGFLERMDGVAPWVKDCVDWSAADVRAGMLALVPGVSRLYIGKPETARGRNSITDVEKIYEVASAGISGSPFEGTVLVMLQAADFESEKPCLEKLRGTAISWASGDNSAFPDVAGKVVVRQVQFSRAARVGSDGKAVATGAMLATLTVSEGVASMVARQLSAHFWGIVASALFTMGVAIGGRLWRQLRKAPAGP